ncbi:hypothetical protein CHLNCDRAFT_51639 [Chlorella variabilis]|uniref:Intraflagellar transport 52-like protein n=1 Tax=Chlorella variabilis TaxID=554065 RepID=E1ZBG5_CHLVA|nr:hypothetical protein CHLNCDRAFT_51639 [Chlorella variabilis]EFN56850.1 hypothetical protein CHLNCDRAFT_51639 [Chlorella variabilis]|eukprot:XP_005848952.1 hypothetical protein CHLNCDRAFT_51639 [Chlorella variabilis]
MEPVVLISACKGEARNLRSGYKQLARHLKAARCDVRRLDAASGLTPAALAQAAIVVFGGPTQPFAPNELDCLRAYLRGGGNLLVLAGEGGEAAAGTNLNSLLADYGLRVAADCVIQTAFTRRAAAAAPAGRQPAKTAASYTAADGRYLHPKQVLVSEGMLSPDMVAYCANNSRAAARRAAGAGGGGAAAAGGRATDENGRPLASFVYPNGSTVVAQAPALPFLSSGQVAHPCNMTIGAAWWQEGGGGSGRLAVLGSAAMFDDEWLAKEDNTALLDFLLGWMLRDPACELRPKNMAEPEIVDPRPVTHVAELAAKPLVCLQEHDDLPRDITKLFADKLFKLDLSLIPQVAALRRAMGAEGVLQRRALPLWRPPLEVPFPPLQPAVFPPAFAEPPPPSLELFDLEEELAGPLEQLSRATAQFLAAPKASQQLEAYVQGCAQLLGLRSARGGGAKEQLAEVLEAVVQCKLPDFYAQPAAGSGEDPY